MTDLALTRRRLIQIGALVPLAGCVGGHEPPRKFSLRPLPALDNSGPSWSLGIDVPQALKGLDTERIAIKSGPNELKYYADADWIDLAPEMVQMVLVRSFQNHTRLDVGTRGLGVGQPDFLLSSYLQDFQAETGGGGQVTLVASLSPATRRKIVRTKSFQAEIRSDDHIDAIVSAFEEALHRVATDLIAWTLATAEEEKREV